MQERITGAQRVILHVQGDEDGLAALIGKVPGVSQVVKSDDGGLEFETTAGQDVRPQVARAVVNAGYDLLVMRPVGVSLEDIFLQLTRDEPTPPEMDGEAPQVEDYDEESDSFDEEEETRG